MLESVTDSQVTTKTCLEIQENLSLQTIHFYLSHFDLTHPLRK